MSTYLLAFVIGDYDFVESNGESNNLPIRVYTPVGQSKQGRFALDVSLNKSFSNALICVENLYLYKRLSKYLKRQRLQYLSM